MEEGKNNPYLGKISLTSSLAWESIKSYLTSPDSYSKEDLLEALKFLVKSIESNELELPYQPNYRLGFSKVKYYESRYFGTMLLGSLVSSVKHPAFDDLSMLIQGCKVRKIGKEVFRFSGPSYQIWSSKKQRGWYTPMSISRGMNDYLVSLALSQSNSKGIEIGRGSVSEFREQRRRSVSEEDEKDQYDKILEEINREET